MELGSLTLLIEDTSNALTLSVKATGRAHKDLTKPISHNNVLESWIMNPFPVVEGCVWIFKRCVKLVWMLRTETKNTVPFVKFSFLLSFCSI